jgi:DNA polymerase III delta prime subunit
MSITFDPKEVIWAQKYRPKALADVILPERIKAEFRQAVENDNAQHLILSGSAGTGKTTSAFAIANELKASVLFINASLETSIDVIRTRVLEFSTTVSAFGRAGRKIVILDEFESMSTLAQNAIKSFSEQFSKNVFFIFTTNHPNKIIEPLHSRCNHVEFKIRTDEKSAIAKEMFSRACEILENESIKYDKQVVAQVIKAKFPDMRSVLVTLQKASIGGELQSIAMQSQSDYKDLLASMKANKWTDMRQWVAENENLFSFTDFYNELSKEIPVDKLPVLVILTSDYQYKISFVVDRQITLTAYLTEVMSEVL